MTPPRRSMPSPRSKWSRRSASAGGAHISIASPATALRRPGGAPVYRHGSPPVRPLCAQPRLHPDLHFPGGILLDEPQFAGLGGRARPVMGGPRGLPPRLCGDTQALACPLRQAVERGDLAGFGEAFHKLWRYYLMYCEGGFRGGAIDVAQVTMVKASNRQQARKRRGRLRGEPAQPPSAADPSGIY